MTEEQPDQQDELFTTRIWKETRDIPNYTDFAISLQDKTVCCRRLFIFYPIFAFLEDAKERLKMPEFDKLFVHKSLYKKKAFEDDLTYYLGENWQFKDEPVRKYLEHLENLERENPKRLLAYVYHLYLALLSGSQILAKERELEEKNNVNDIYTYKGTDFIPHIKMDFRAAMNEIIQKMTKDKKVAPLAKSYNVFKKNNVKETDKVMNYKLHIKIDFLAAINEIVQDLTEDEKVALLAESYNVIKKNNVKETDKLTDLTPYIKIDFRAAINEILQDLTKDEKLALLAESYKVIKKNNVKETDKVTDFTPHIKIDFPATMNEIVQDLTKDEKVALLAESYNVFKKNNVKETDKVKDFTEADIPQIKKDFRAAVKEIDKLLTEADKMDLILESCKVLEKKDVEDFYTDKVTDFTEADIPQIKKDFRAAMNEIAKDLTEVEKMALIAESYNVFKNNNLLLNHVYVEGQRQNKVIWVTLYKVYAFVVAIIAILVVYKHFL